MSLSEERRTYRLGRAWTDGGFFGLRTGQLVWLIGAVGLALVLVVALPLFQNLVLAVVALGLGVGLAFTPAWGRTLDQWVVIMVAWLRGGHAHRAQRSWQGWGADGEAPVGRLPAALKAVELVETTRPGGEAFGLLHDRSRNVWLALLQVHGGPFAMESEGEQAERCDRWGEVLRRLAQVPLIGALQWIERTHAESTDRIGADLRRRRVEWAPAVALENYLAVVDEARSATVSHEIFLVVELDGGKAGQAIRRNGGGAKGAAHVMYETLRLVQRELRSLELEVEGVLRPRSVAKVMRDSYDSSTRPMREWGGVVRPETAGVDPAAALPAAWEEGWGCLKVEGMYVAAYVVSEWPLSDTGPGFLIPMLLWTQSERAVSVTMRPLDQIRATRKVRRDKLEADSNDALRQRAGFRSGAAQRRERDQLERMDSQLAHGSAQYRYVGFVTVSGRSKEALEDACAQVEQDAHTVGCVLQRLWGEQAEGFVATLPLCRGLRK